MTRDAAIVKIVREMRGLTQFELATKVGVKEPTIRRLERGESNIRVTTWAKVADALGLQFDWSTGKITPPSNVPDDAIRAIVRSRSEVTIEPADKVTQLLSELSELVASGALTTGKVMEVTKRAAAKHKPKE